MVWIFHYGVAIYKKGVAISISVSRAPCRSQKYFDEFIVIVFCVAEACHESLWGVTRARESISHL